MIAYTAKLDLSGAARFAQMPRQLDAHLDFAFDRIGLEGVRVMRREAPKFQSLLTNSVHSERTGPYQVTVAPGVNYAAYVNNGTGPAAGNARYVVNPEKLYEWVKAHPSISFRNTRRGSAARAAQYDEIRDRAWALAAYISRHGTKPNDFVGRAATFMEKRAPEILEAQLAKLAGEVGSA